MFLFDNQFYLCFPDPAIPVGVMRINGKFFGNLPGMFTVSAAVISSGALDSF